MSPEKLSNFKRLLALVFFLFFFQACEWGMDTPGFLRGKETTTPVYLIPTVIPVPADRKTKPTETGPIQMNSPLPPSELQESFRLAPKMGLGKTTITDICQLLDGSIWLATTSGLWAFDGYEWQLLLKQPVGKIIGADGAGRTWVLLANGVAIASFSNKEWQIYGADEGWNALAPDAYLNPSAADGLVTDPSGRIWLATGGNDLRRFDPVSGLWQTFTAEEIGFPAQIEQDYQGHFLSDVVLLASGEVWVSDCIGEGENLSGGGIRQFNQEKWEDIPFAEGQCIPDMELDDQGKIWAGGMDALYQFDPESAVLNSYMLPAWDRLQLIVKVDLDPLQRPYLEVWRAGGASFQGATIRLHLENGTWVEDFAPGTWEPSDLIFGKKANWLCSGEAVYEINNNKTRMVLEFKAGSCKGVEDEEGRLWVALPGKTDDNLWWHEY